MTTQRPPAVLIVEDERIVAMDLQQMLREFGYDAFAIASSADEALARAAERCPDLALMDIRIKGKLDGIETAALLKTRFGVPVVYLTAHADDGTLDRAKRTEPLGYLLKPVKAAELRSAVEVALYKHQMEKRLRERERWFSTTLRSIADAVITVDLAGKVTYMNPAATSLTGVEPAAAMGRPIVEVLRLSGHAAGDDSPVLQALREGRTVELREGTLENVASGASRLINDSAAPVVDDAETLGAVMIFRDVTDQKKVQRQLELNDRLASLGTMAAGVAHEINNPLAVVMANAAFLAEELNELQAPGGALPPAAARKLAGAAEALRDLESAGTRIGRIVADLRAFSRPPQTVADDVEVERCVEWALRTTAHEFRHRARVVVQVQAVPRVKADELRLGQVLINLLVNAAHAIAPGQAERNEVRVTTSRLDDGRILIEVQDSGSGIPAAVLPHIFEPFYTTKAVGTGTGLGLSICHGIVVSLGGAIQVESEEGKGTTVRVTLPAAAAAAPAAPAPAPERKKPARGRILVIDDEEMVRRALARVFRDHDLTLAESAAQALALLDEGRSFDLILSDLMMPVMTGIELYEELLRRDPRLASQVVFMSGGATTSRAADFLRSVPNRFIAKPFAAGALQALLEERLSAAPGPALSSR